MEETIRKIKEYVLQLEPTIENVDFVVGEMVDRVLAYTRRDSIPTELERPIAKAIVKLSKDEKTIIESEMGEISSISDNGQGISFKSKKDSRMIQKEELSMLDELKPLLDKYILAKVFREDEITK